MKHAFFADMGGFLLQTTDRPPQTINADILLLLIQKKCISFPEHKKAAIDDKNKRDGLARYGTSYGK